jgi:hypothetical protein
VTAGKAAGGLQSKRRIYTQSGIGARGGEAGRAAPFSIGSMGFYDLN